MTVRLRPSPLYTERLTRHLTAFGKEQRMMTDNDNGALRKRIQSAQRIVFFTGAGMSAESGIPTFRDALTGLWSRFDVTALASKAAYLRDPSLVGGGTNGGA